MLWRRKWAVGLAAGVAGCLLAASAVLAADQGMVVTRDGFAFEGTIEKSGTQVIITQKNGAKTTVAGQSVDHIYIYDPNDPRQEFDAQMAKARLKPKDVAGWLSAARWALDHKQYDMARAALEEAARTDATNAEVKTLQKQLADSHPAGATQPGVNPATQPSPGDGGNHAGPKGPAKRMVTQKEIQAIRQLEWRQGDRTVKVKVPADVRKRFIDANIVPDAGRLSQNDLAFAIMQQGPPALRDQVQITSDPAPMVEFRQKVEKQVVQASCLQCHLAGKLQGDHNQLALFAGDNDPATYTNFIVLQQFTKEIQLKPKDRPIEYSMIDRTRPEGSLLPQYALPPDLADVPHPQAAGYKGAVKNKTDMRYRELLGWIESLSPLAPDYSFIDLTQEPPPDAKDPAAPKPAAGGGRAGAAR
jgi:hypothetical protein